MDETFKYPQFKATSYRISTITVTGGIESDVDLNALYDVMVAHPRDAVHYIEYGMSKHDLKSYGTKKGAPTRKSKSKSKTVSEKAQTSKKRFDNQLTIVFMMENNMYNTKLFKNGNVQITGVKDVDAGKRAIDTLILMLKDLHNISKENCNVSILKNIEKVVNTNYKVRLINSDFRVNFEIRLDHLFRVITQQYNIVCSYEPCIYPGAKVEYYYPNDGICRCSGMCNGKSDECKKITIAVFQSGCVIITGANCVEHINAAYEFICRVLDVNMQEIYRHRLKPSSQSQLAEVMSRLQLTPQTAS